MSFSKQAVSCVDDLRELPMVQDGKGIWQNEWHPHDVYGHTVEVVRILRELTASPELIAAGWLHDVGKPPVRLPEIKSGALSRHPRSRQLCHSFNGHEKVGEEMVRTLPEAMFSRLGLDQHRIARIVGSHFLPMTSVKRMKQDPAPEHFERVFHDLSTALDRTGLKSEIMTIFYADKASQKPSDLDFLLSLRCHLLEGRMDLRRVHSSFVAAYGLK